MLGEQTIRQYVEILGISVAVHFVLLVICFIILLYKSMKFNALSIEKFPNAIGNFILFGAGVFIQFNVFFALYQNVYRAKDFGYPIALYTESIIEIAITMIICIKGISFLWRVILWKETKEKNEKERVRIC